MPTTITLTWNNRTENTYQVPEGATIPTPGGPNQTFSSFETTTGTIIYKLDEVALIALNRD